MMQLAMSLGLTKVALLLSIIANLVIIIIILVIVIIIIITIILVIVIVIIILIIVIIITSQWSSWSRRCSRSAEGEDLFSPTSLLQGNLKLVMSQGTLKLVTR